LRPNVDNTGVMSYLDSEYQYYHNVDTGSLVVHRLGVPFLRFNPQCLISEACFWDWVDSVAFSIDYLDSKGMIHEEVKQ